MGDKLMVDLSRSLRSIRMAAVSTKFDEPDCSAFVFRSYALPGGAQSHYEGSSKYKIWEAVRASSAAPGYFSEFRLDNSIFQVNSGIVLKVIFDLKCAFLGRRYSEQQPDSYRSPRVPTVVAERKIMRRGVSGNWSVS